MKNNILSFLLGIALSAVLVMGFLFNTLHKQVVAQGVTLQKDDTVLFEKGGVVDIINAAINPQSATAAAK